MEFIAEVASNHNQNLARCLDFVDAAADIGCDAVKFQLFDIERLFSPEVLLASDEHRRRRDWQLPREFVPLIAQRCRRRGIRFGCTPFDLEAVSFLEAHVDFFKIASYELLWLALIEACARTGKPTMLSTGMATLAEVDAGVRAARSTGNRNISVLHCVSAYPTRRDECNLAVIATLRQHLSCAVGWSDHSHDPVVVRRAIHRWQVEIVEFHLDIDDTGCEHGFGHCWLPEEIKPLIDEARLCLEVDGSAEKFPVRREYQERGWRAEPQDGWRPMRCVRQQFQKR